METYQENWKTKLLVIGTIAGAALGFATAFMMAKAAEDEDAGPPQIDVMDALKVGIGVVGTMRTITAMSNRKQQA
jgi:formate/nitrite transporter FocA (FNT family)